MGNNDFLLTLQNILNWKTVTTIAAFRRGMFKKSAIKPQYNPQNSNRQKNYAYSVAQNAAHNSARNNRSRQSDKKQRTAHVVTHFYTTISGSCSTIKSKLPVATAASTLFSSVGSCRVFLLNASKSAARAFVAFFFFS